MNQEKLLAEYFAFLELDIPSTLDLNTLNEIIRRHMSKVPYQNFGLVTDRMALKTGKNPVVKLELECLFDKLVREKRGAMCYETSELLFWALQKIGYEIIKVRSIARIGDSSFAEKPYMHQSLIVFIQGQAYTADPGFGYSGFYGALPINLDKTTVVEASNGDKYKIEPHESYYRISSWIGSGWFAFYDFDKPLVTATLQDGIKDVDGLISRGAPITDTYLKPGLLRENGSRVGFNVSLEPGKWRASMTFFPIGKPKTQVNLQDPNAVKGAIREHLGLELPSEIYDLLSTNYQMQEATSKNIKVALVMVAISILTAASMRFICKNNSGMACR